MGVGLTTAPRKTTRYQNCNNTTHRNSRSNMWNSNHETRGTKKHLKNIIQLAKYMYPIHPSISIIIIIIITTWDLNITE